MTPSRKGTQCKTGRNLDHLQNIIKKPANIQMINLLLITKLSKTPRLRPKNFQLSNEINK